MKNLLDSIIVDEECPPDTMLFIPKIGGLCMRDGELKIRESKQVSEDVWAYFYRDLTDGEKKQFAMIKNIGEK